MPGYQSQDNEVNNSLYTEDELFIKYLNYNCPDLVELAKDKDKDKNFWEKRWEDLNNIWKNVFEVYIWKRLIVDTLFADSEDFQGENTDSEDLKKDADITAGIISGANLLNAITNWPILYSAFRNFTVISPLITTVLLEIIVLKWSNKSGTAVKPGKRRWAYLAAFWFFLMSILQSIVAGIGAELINNQTQLQIKKAEEVIEDYRAKYLVGFAPKNYPGYAEAKPKCDRLEAQLAKLPIGSFERNRAFLEARGTWEQWNDNNFDWSTYDGTLPFCQLKTLAENRFRDSQK